MTLPLQRFSAENAGFRYAAGRAQGVFKAVDWAGLYRDQVINYKGLTDVYRADSAALAALSRKVL